MLTKENKSKFNLPSQLTFSKYNILECNSWMDRWTDKKQIDGQKKRSDRCINKRTNICTDRLMDEQRVRRIDRQTKSKRTDNDIRTDKQIDRHPTKRSTDLKEQKDGQKDGQTGGQSDGWTEKQSD